MIMLPLTPREYEIATLIERELDCEDISDMLGISVWTVKKHVKTIRIKLGVRSMREIPEAMARRSAEE